MIAYLDTSAFVPLIIAEPTSDRCGRLWDDADRLVTTRLTFMESAAAMATAERIGRITDADHIAGRRQMMELWAEFDVIELDEQLMIAASDAAGRHGLRGYDAVHFAAAAALDDDTLVAGAGDRRLLDAWTSHGVNVLDTSAADTVAVDDAGAEHDDR